MSAATWIVSLIACAAVAGIAFTIFYCTRTTLRDAEERAKALRETERKVQEEGARQDGQMGGGEEEGWRSVSPIVGPGSGRGGRPGYLEDVGYLNDVGDSEDDEDEEELGDLDELEPERDGQRRSSTQPPPLTSETDVLDLYTLNSHSSNPTSSRRRRRKKKPRRLNSGLQAQPIAHDPSFGTSTLIAYSNPPVMPPLTYTNQTNNNGQLNETMLSGTGYSGTLLNASGGGNGYSGFGRGEERMVSQAFGGVSGPQIGLAQSNEYSGPTYLDALGVGGTSLSADSSQRASQLPVPVPPEHPDSLRPQSRSTILVKPLSPPPSESFLGSGPVIPAGYSARPVNTFAFVPNQESSLQGAGPSDPSDPMTPADEPRRKKKKARERSSRSRSRSREPAAAVVAVTEQAVLDYYEDV